MSHSTASVRKLVSKIRQSYKVRKLCQFIILITLLPLWLSIVIVVRLIKPLVHFRFGEIDSEFFGHFNTSTELYLCHKKEEQSSRKIVDLFYLSYPQLIENQWILRLRKRSMNISKLYQFLHIVNKWIPFGHSHETSQTIEKSIATPIYDIHNVMERQAITLLLSPDEEALAKEKLTALGVNNLDKVMCFADRTSKYMFDNNKKRNRIDDREELSNFHNFSEYRNLNSITLVPSIKYLVSKGYTCIRIGKNPGNAFEFEHPNVIDFSYRHYDPLLEIYINKISQFLISGNGGVTSLAYIYRKPRYIINYNLWDFESYSSLSYTFPIMIKDSKKHCYLSPEKLCQLSYADLDPSLLRRQHLEIIKPSAEDVLEGTKEFVEGIESNSKTSAEQERFEKIVWPIIKKYSLTLNGVPFHSDPLLGKISTQFLKKFPSIFET